MLIKFCLCLMCLKVSYAGYKIFSSHFLSLNILDRVLHCLLALSFVVEKSDDHQIFFFQDMCSVCLN